VGRKWFPQTAEEVCIAAGQRPVTGRVDTPKLVLV
jgi:hypothetical protein